jgi:NADH-quinone oxidoreductase subunit C
MDRPLKEELETIFKDIRVTSGEDQLTITVEPSQVLPLLGLLKDRGFDHMTLLSTVDRIDEGRLEMVYVLTRYSSGVPEGPPGETLVMVKTLIPREDPRVKSAIGVFANLEPYEREAHELFGVDFEGHPRLIPLFLEREYPIPPFRKDFDTRKYVEDVFDSIPYVSDEDDQG